MKGSIGVGALTPTILFGALVIGPHHAVALALIANLLSQLQFLGTGFRDGDWVIARRVIVPNFAFATFGVWVFGRIDAPVLILLLGGVLGLLALSDLLGWWTRLAEVVDLSRPGPVFALSGFAGLVSGVTGAGGLLFIAVYLRVICPEKARFRGTILLLSLLVVAWRTFVMAVSGHIGLTDAAEGILLFPAIMLGGFTGTVIYGRISERRFSRVLQSVILFGAAVLLWRGLRQVAGE